MQGVRLLRLFNIADMIYLYYNRLARLFMITVAKYILTVGLIMFAAPLLLIVIFQVPTSMLRSVLPTQLLAVAMFVT